MKDVDWKAVCNDAVALLQLLRKTQKTYFKTRRLDDLETAKKIEAKIDKFLDDWKRWFLEQGSLFE